MTGVNIRTMKQRTVIIGIAIAFLTGCQMEQNTTPVFTKIHTVSIHVKDHAIHLVRSDLKEITAVVFKVASLESAVRYLETNKMLGDRNQNSVKVKTPDEWDFTIVLQE